MQHDPLLHCADFNSEVLQLERACWSERVSNLCENFFRANYEVPVRLNLNICIKKNKNKVRRLYTTSSSQQAI